MESSVYSIEAEIEESHWWFVGRRKLIARIISSLDIPIDASILDIGTSSGANLHSLKSLGYQNFCGVDISEEAINFCRQKGFEKVSKGDICNLPFPSNQFHLVLATDIIEHVDDDVRALSEVKRVLRPGGVAIITVPAFNFLWGLQDEVSYHKRRYRKKELKRKVVKAGLSCFKSFYFNYLLFIPIWLGRRIIKLLKIQIKSENELNTPVLNFILSIIFSLDVWSAPFIKPPFGVSIMMVAKKA